MKRQWSLILAFIFALVVAIFAVINVEPVEVDYLFGTSDWPLVLVILGSVVMGAIIIAAAGMFKYIALKRENRLLKKDNQRLKEELENHPNQSDIENNEINEENQELENR